MPIFYNQVEDGDHDDNEKNGEPVNLNHGVDCDRCNDAQLATMENNRRRSGTFHQTINNIRSRKTDKSIDALTSLMLKNKQDYFGPKDDER